MMINEYMFYGGLIAAAVIIVLFLIFLIIFRIDKIKLDYKYNEEYGKRIK